MKVVFINRFFHPDHSATAQMLSDLAFGLAGRGTEVQVICSRQGYDHPQGTLPATEEVHGVRVHRVATSAFGRGSLLGRSLDYATFYVSAAACLNKVLLPGDLAVAMTDPPMLSSVIAGVARRRGAALVNWLQDVFPEVAQRARIPGVRGPVAAALRRLRKRALADALWNVVIGECMARILIDSGAAPRETVTVIPNWADGRAIAPLAHGDNPLRRAWAPDDSFVVSYSGNLGSVHDYETILGAVRRLRHHGDVLFLMIGGGAGMRALQRRAREEDLANLRFEPYQPRERLIESLGAADVHLCTLRPEFEGLIQPSKFYGIGAAGRPTIFVGDTQGETATILRQAECGIAIPAGDDAALAEAIVELRDQREQRELMGSRARAHFEKHFDLPVAMRAWRTILSLPQD